MQVRAVHEPPVPEGTGVYKGYDRASGEWRQAKIE
jgi:hypothetical protein